MKGKSIQYNLVMRDSFMAILNRLSWIQNCHFLLHTNVNCDMIYPMDLNSEHKHQQSQVIHHIHFLNDCHFKWKLSQFQLSSSIRGTKDLHAHVLHTDNLEKNKIYPMHTQKHRLHYCYWWHHSIRMIIATIGAL